MKSKNKYHLVSPYVFSLSVIGLAGMIVCYSLILYFLTPILSDETSDDLIQEWIWVYLFIGINVFAYIIACILDGFTFWGVMKINCMGVLFHAPFRKRIYLSFSDIKHIGIDFVSINGVRQYWIYMSKKPIFPQYLGKINKMPFTPQQVRIQYSETVCADLLSVLQPHLKKQLQNSKTILRTVPSKK